MKNIKTKIWTFLGTAIMLLPFVLGLGTAEVSRPYHLDQKMLRLICIN